MRQGASYGVLKREDLPANLPKEEVDRLLAIQKMGSWYTRLPMYLMYVLVAFVVFGGAQRFGISQGLAIGLTLPAIFALHKVSAFFIGRDHQKALVAIGGTCPRCHQPLHIDTWSPSKQQAERDAWMQGYCPRCFEHIGPNIHQQTAEWIEKNKARLDAPK